ncbi:hypothetical protein B0T16DRAFT_384363 [Cercophora newfieldiana]|uniref:Uncharacterized protein n=1 Tax=Cercophora newfieldiana TaxID=92897 RepID=A0AA40CZZ5_9PEZI|nr:hypothetical protein B0T16DRAFT_384363 [Cercophora newfieldiana]
MTAPKGILQRHPFLRWLPFVRIIIISRAITVLALWLPAGDSQPMLFAFVVLFWTPRADAKSGRYYHVHSDGTVSGTSTMKHLPNTNGRFRGSANAFSVSGDRSRVAA